MNVIYVPVMKDDIEKIDKNLQKQGMRLKEQAKYLPDNEKYDKYVAVSTEDIVCLMMGKIQRAGYSGQLLEDMWNPE